MTRYLFHPGEHALSREPREYILLDLTDPAHSDVRNRFGNCTVLQNVETGGYATLTLPEMGGRWLREPDHADGTGHWTAA